MSGRPALAPSILSADFAHLGRDVRRVERAGADWLHVDVMDGHFVPNITVGPVVVHWLKKHTSLRQDVHLMIDKPETFIPAFARAGAWLITVHWETCTHPLRTIRLIRRHGCRVGMTVRPRTPIQKLQPWLRHLDLALVMTVEPGFGGQRFMPEMLPKIRWLKSQRERLPRSRRLWIEADGGINPETAPLVVRAGADALVAGQAVFGDRRPGAALRELRRQAGVAGC